MAHLILCKPNLGWHHDMKKILIYEEFLITNKIDITIQNLKDLSCDII
jgi:hypothetical protein